MSAIIIWLIHTLLQRWQEIESALSDRPLTPSSHLRRGRLHCRFMFAYAIQRVKKSEPEEKEVPNEEKFDVVGLCSALSSYLALDSAQRDDRSLMWNATLAPRKQEKKSKTV